ncbi:MAG: hypothetical protein WD851_18615 [Pirellulales bacterium]
MTAIEAAEYVDTMIDRPCPTWAGSVAAIRAAEQPPWLDWRKIAKPIVSQNYSVAHLLIEGLLTTSAAIHVGAELAHQVKQSHIDSICLWIDSEAGQVSALTHLLPVVEAACKFKFVVAYVLKAFGPAAVLARHCRVVLGHPNSRIGLLAGRLPLVSEYDEAVRLEHELDVATFRDYGELVKYPIGAKLWERLQESWLNGEQAEAADLIHFLFPTPCAAFANRGRC